MNPCASDPLGLTDATSKVSGLAAGWADVIPAAKIHTVVPIHTALINAASQESALMTFAGAILCLRFE